MLDPAKQGYVMVALFNARFGTGKQTGRREYLQLRGFISRSALPGTGLGRGPAFSGKSTDEILSFSSATRAATTGCTQADLGLPRTSNTSSLNASFPGVASPQFQFFYHYDGNYPDRIPTASASASQRVRVDPSGNRYSNYGGWPFPNLGTYKRRPAALDPSRVQQVKIEANTTGLDGGGIVRAIVPATTPYDVLDSHGTTDPNGYCSPEPDDSSRIADNKVANVAQWAFLKTREFPLEGFVPYKRPGPPGYDAGGCP